MTITPESHPDSRVRTMFWAFTALALSGSVSAPCISGMTGSEPLPVVARVATSVGETAFCPRRDLVGPASVASLTVDDLRDYCGLTASQIGRLFGVSRRSINNWISGNSMAPRHEERLSQIQQIMLSLLGRTPDERRAELLASSTGPSIFQQLVDEVVEDAVLHENPLAAKDQF